MKCSTLPLTFCFCNVVEAHGYSFRSTVVSGQHSRSKTSAIIAMYDVSTDVLYVTKTLVVETSYIAIIALVLLRECSPLTTVDSVSVYAHLYSNLNGLVPIEWLEVFQHAPIHLQVIRPSMFLHLVWKLSRAPGTITCSVLWAPTLIRFLSHAGKEKRVGGFDLLWNDGPVHSDEVGLHCGQPLVYSLNSHIGCRNNREEQLLSLFKDPAKFKHVYVRENKWTRLASWAAENYRVFSSSCIYVSTMATSVLILCIDHVHFCINFMYRPCPLLY